MKVLDLQCHQGHGFEGWFGSEEDFQNQRQRGLLACPLCGSGQVGKKLSAPRLNLATSKASRGPAAGAPTPSAADKTDHAAEKPAGPPSAGHGAALRRSAADMQQLHAAWLTLARQIVAQTEDVGPRFADEARKMHYGDAQSRNIRGLASPRQAAELLEEGIEIMPLPAAAKEPLQ